MLLPRLEVAEPQYYFFPHTPWITQQHVTQCLCVLPDPLHDKVPIFVM